MIADDLIALDHKTLRQHRANLLLMRTECALRLNDLQGAYRGLSELHPMSLSLLESLQRLPLRTLYESNTRRYDHVVHGWREKVVSADLMPQAQSLPECMTARSSVMTLVNGMLVIIGVNKLSSPGTPYATG